MAITDIFASILGGLKDVAGNPAAMELIGAAGRDISAGRPVGKEVGVVATRQRGAESFAGLLGKLLGPGVDFTSKADGKVTIGGSSFESLAGLLGGGSALDPNGMSLPTDPEIPVAPTGGQPDLLNPSASPLGDLTISDLAGLTAQDVGTALQLKLAFDTLAQRKVTAATKDIRTSEQKNFEFAQSQGFEGSFIDFKNAAKTTHQKEFKQAKAEGFTGDFNEWLLDMAKAGAINLGDVIERKQATEEIKSEAFFTDPKGLSKAINEHLDDSAQFARIQGSDNPKREKARIAEEFVTSTISSAGGVVTDSRLEGNVFVWTVKWPSGRTSEVRYAN